MATAGVEGRQRGSKQEELLLFMAFLDKPLPVQAQNISEFLHKY
jgi:hypothetical protein